MHTRLLVPAALLGLFAASAYHQSRVDGEAMLDAQEASILALAAGNPPAAPGVFPDQWIFGADCVNDPKIQVHEYNEDTYILRQSKCETFEAPFMFLLFGSERAVLLDTGANPNTPVQPVVQGIVDAWLARTGKASIDLVVQHTHGHFDHTQADAQFVGAPYVTNVVPTASGIFQQSWGFQNYPEDVPSFDLGGRVVDVLGTPGHYPDSVSVYDRNTQLLLTGDIVYPGHLFIFQQSQWIEFAKSIRRLGEWAAANPVSWVVGCHVETADTPFSPYAYGTPVQPNEHPLELEPVILNKILRAVRSMGSDPVCKIFGEFVIHPVYKCGITWNG